MSGRFRQRDIPVTSAGRKGISKHGIARTVKPRWRMERCISRQRGGGAHAMTIAGIQSRLTLLRRNGFINRTLFDRRR